MIIGASLHVGINNVDETVYGSDQQLQGCINDAHAMRDIAEFCDYKPTVLLDDKATSENIIEVVTDWANRLEAGDSFLWTHASHGSQLFNTDKEDYEPDGLDETWVLYDRQFLDDEVMKLLKQFKEGVRVKLISDTCHSGSIYKALQMVAMRGEFAVKEIFENLDENLIDYIISRPELTDSDVQHRFLSEEVSHEIFKNNEEKYRGVKKDAMKHKDKIVKASIEVISACQDNQLAGDGMDNGYFTSKLLSTWKDGQFQGNNTEFFEAIKRSMKRRNQTPTRTLIGPQDQEFLTGRPFNLN